MILLRSTSPTVSFQLILQSDSVTQPRVRVSLFTVRCRGDRRMDVSPLKSPFQKKSRKFLSLVNALITIESYQPCR
jgi:hypothetical protein